MRSHRLFSGVRVPGVSVHQNGQRHPETHPRPHLALHLQPPSERQRPLAHPRDPYPGVFSRVESPAVVFDLHPRLVVHYPEGDGGAPGPRVAPDVGQRLLDDTHDLDPHRPGERDGELPAHDQVERTPWGHLSVQLHDGFQRADERLLLGALQPQLVDGVAQTLHRPLEGLYLAARLFVAAVRFRHPPGELQGLQSVGKVLEDNVVQLARYAAALGLPDLAQALLQAPALGYVLHRALVAGHLASGVADGASARRGPHHAPVLAVYLDLEPGDEIVLLHQAAELLPALAVDVELLRDVRDVLEQLLGRVVAEHAGQRGVGRNEPSFDRGLEDPLHGVLEDPPVLLLGEAALLFRIHALGYVLVDQDDLLDVTDRILDRIDERPHPPIRNVAHVRNGLFWFVLDGRDRNRLPVKALFDVGHYALLDQLRILQHVVPRYLVEGHALESLPSPVYAQRPAVGGEDLDAQGGLLDHQPEARLGYLEFLLRPPAFAAHLGIAQLALDGGVQAGQVVLHDVVVGAGLHGRHRGVLAYVAAHDDEREIHEAFAPELLQRRRRAELRHGMEIGEHTSELQSH